MDDFLRKGPGSQWDVYADRLRAQLPPAPDPLLDGYVRFAPWIAIVFGVLGVFFLLVAGAVLAVVAPFLVLGGASGVGAGASAFLSVVVGLVLAALEVVGGYLMLQRRLTGWWILGLGLVANALNALFQAAIFGLIITVLIAYVHLLVKPRYN